MHPFSSSNGVVVATAAHLEIVTLLSSYYNLNEHILVVQTSPWVAAFSAVFYWIDKTNHKTNYNYKKEKSFKNN